MHFSNGRFSNKETGFSGAFVVGGLLGAAGEKKKKTKCSYSRAEKKAAQSSVFSIKKRLCSWSWHFPRGRWCLRRQIEQLQHFLKIYKILQNSENSKFLKILQNFSAPRGFGAFALRPRGVPRGFPPPHRGAYPLYVGRLTPISSRVQVIFPLRGWAMMAPMLIPYCDFDDFQYFRGFGRVREKKSDPIKSLQDFLAFAPLQIQKLCKILPKSMCNFL